MCLSSLLYDFCMVHLLFVSVMCAFQYVPSMASVMDAAVFFHAALTSTHIVIWLKSQRSNVGKCVVAHVVPAGVA